MRWVVGLFCLCSSLQAGRVEIYEDWLSDVAGDALYQKPQEGVSPSHYQIIAHLLEAGGYSVQSWDRKAHAPWLMTWKNVHGVRDLIQWLGFGWPKKGLDEETSQVIFCNHGLHLKDLDLGKMPKEKLILFAWEPVVVQPELYDPNFQAQFHKIYTWDDDLVDNVRFFKFYLPYLTNRFPDLVPYEERKLLTMIVSRYRSKHPKELYSEREKLVAFFEARPEEEFDLYGRYWKKRYRTWKGTVVDKFEVLKKYRFSIAYENSLGNGYITEKLWDCLAAGVVPIYWGAPNITDYLPADCFIDRRLFKDDAELVAFLKAMPREEWEGYVRRGGEFLLSDAAKKFTVATYARSVAESVLQR